jgi:hypothetical protein
LPAALVFHVWAATVAKLATEKENASKALIDCFQML